MNLILKELGLDLYDDRVDTQPILHFLHRHFEYLHFLENFEINGFALKIKVRAYILLRFYQICCAARNVSVRAVMNMYAARIARVG